MDLTDIEMWLEIASSHQKVPINRRRFSALIGLKPEVVSVLWVLVADRLRAEHQDPLHLLWLLYWFKVYDTDDICSITWAVDRGTFGLHRDICLMVLYESLDLV